MSSSQYERNSRGVPPPPIPNLALVYLVLLETLEETLRVGDGAAGIIDVIEIEIDPKDFFPADYHVR